MEEVIAYLFSAVIVIFLTLPIHEWAHAFAASKLGDPTPRYQGRLTLNPFAHIDYIGALCILLCGFGWAKPVGVNTRYFNNPKRDMAITAFAGPLSNIVLAFISLIILNIIIVSAGALSGIFVFVYNMLFYVAYINIGLAVFNLIPIPPLDGSRLLSAFLPDRLYYKLMQYERVLYYVILALIITGVLDVPLSYATEGILSGLINLTNLIFSIF
jgi:Zn-dependent protease